VPGINDTPKELEMLKKSITRINPDKIQINYIHRPGTEGWVKAPSSKRIADITDFFGRKAENVNRYKPSKSISKKPRYLKKQILQTLNRRPCTVSDLSKITGIHMKDIYLCINELMKENKITERKHHRSIFYTGLHLKGQAKKARK
jgi:wyosine [tRNA(Phe)-imidazoG37] synthetase (radical SAM superfamily)